MTTGNVTIKKDNNNLIGISIGGGAPFCPCLYIVQVLMNIILFSKDHLLLCERLAWQEGLYKPPVDFLCAFLGI